jgi:L-arabinokinase
VALAVSGHGFGHAVRCAEVARVLLQRHARVVVRTEAPRWLFPDGVDWVAAESPLDIGVAQHDGFDLDIDETRRRWACFATSFEAHAESEARALQQQRVDVVVGDIPPLAFAAAARAGVPSLALANFGWDWIYSAWPGFEEIVATVRAGYSDADVLLRLPLHATSEDAFPGFRRIEDVPLVARRARRPRQEVRGELGLSDDARVVLLSFGGFTAHGIDLNAFGRRTGYIFVVTPPLAVNNLPGNVLALNETPADYVSLLAACDVVVTKPGYGIVADCLANRVAMLFTDRGPFREYDVLAEALPRLGRARYVPRTDLMSGELAAHLEALFASNDPWTEEPMNGADVVAGHVIQMADARKR